MTPELEKIISEIKNDKIRNLLQHGENSPLQKTYIDPALETLAREILKLETELRRVG